MANPTLPERPEAPRESTLDLLERLRAGDREALERICARYYPALRRWASGRLPGWARDLRETDDLVQETLVRTLQHVDSFENRGEGALAAYLRQAVLNAVRDEMRRVGRRPAAVEPRADEASPGASPVEEAIGNEWVERYESALASLRDEEREAIVLRVEMELAYEEVASALGKPTANAARMTVSRALVRLAEAMGTGEGAERGA
jgi:RNA polymerase sigma-70 factor (ECF subfamily)